MPAPSGNQFWKVRSSHGRKPMWRSSEQLWEACSEYFEWTEENPLIEMKAFAYQGVVTQEPVAKMRAMTIKGLCIFLGMSLETWCQYRKNKDFSDVIARVEDIISTQKFTGAAADLLNANIIARDLGLIEKKEIEHSGVIETLSDKQIDERLEQLIAGSK